MNFKRHVICCKHWATGTRKDLLDVPAVKFTSLEKSVPKQRTQLWNCAAALCTNSWRTKKDNLTYYRLSTISSCPEKKRDYGEILKNKGVDFRKDFICSEHWSRGFRKDINDLPDVPCTSDYEYEAKNETKRITPKSKLKSAKRALDELQTKPTKRRRKLSYRKEKVNPQMLENEILELKKKLKEKTDQVEKLANEVSSLIQQNASYAQQLKHFSQLKNSCTFAYDNLKQNVQKFQYMTGLSPQDFDCLYECIEPYITCIIYPDCKNHHIKQRKLSKKTELMCFLTVCRHTLHLGIMGFMVNTSEATQSRIFTGWAVFLAALFDMLDLAPCPGELQSLLPREFWASGFQDTVVLGDCTGNWIASPENYDVSSVTFSSYKNHDTGKTGV